MEQQAASGMQIEGSFQSFEVQTLINLEMQ